MTALAVVWAPAVVLAAIEGVLALASPLAALGALAIVFPFDAPLVVKAPVTVYSGEALVGGLLLGLGCRWLRTRGQLARTAMTAGVWLAVLSAAALLSAIHAVDRWGVVKQALRWAQLWLVFAAVVQYARDRSAPARLAAAYAGMAVVLGALGIAEALSGPGSWLNMPGWVLDENPLVERAHGPFHPNLFAPYLSIALLLAGAHLRTWAARVPGWLVAAGGGLAAAALILTQSRTGWVAYAVALAVWSAVRARPRRVLAAAGLALVLAIGAAVAVPSLRGRLASMTAPWNAPSFQFRVQAFRFGLSLWAGHPLTGIGAGNYGVAFDRRLAAGAPNPGEGMRFHVHNFFLQTGLETGFVGLVAWLGVLGWLLVHFWGMRARAPGGAALGLGLLALFVAGNMLEVTVTQARGLMYAFGWGIAAAMGAGGTPRGAVAVRRTRGLS